MMISQQTVGNQPPQNVANVRTVLRVAEVINTTNQMLGRLAQNVLHWFAGYPDARARYELDPERKAALIVFSVLLDETATPEEIAAARKSLGEQFDAFVAESKPKFSRIALPDADLPPEARGGIILQ